MLLSIRSTPRASRHLWRSRKLTQVPVSTTAEQAAHDPLEVFAGAVSYAHCCMRTSLCDFLHFRCLSFVHVANVNLEEDGVDCFGAYPSRCSRKC
jgi:hypothetical protein